MHVVRHDRMIAVPAAFSSPILFRHLTWKPSSPTASTSSTRRMPRVEVGRHREAQPHRHA